MMDPKLDSRANDANMKVAAEDIAVLNHLNPIRTPESNTKEILLPTDQAVVKFREFLGQWEAQGCRIDLKKLRDDAGMWPTPSPAQVGGLRATGYLIRYR